MRYREFLVEYQRAAEQQRIESTSAYQGRLQQDPEFSLERAEEIDPTPNKAYVSRIANWWLKGESYADLKQILPQALAQFQQYKQVLNPEHKDINRFKTASEFASVVQTYQAAAEQRAKEKQEQEQQKQQDRGNYREIYKDNELRVIEILDRKAAQFWGQSTQWCTASKKEASHYNLHSSQGPLLVIIPLPAQFVTYRNDEDELVKSQVRYQYWFNRKDLDLEQFANVKNQDINPKRLPFFKKLQQIIYPMNSSYKWNPNPSKFETQVQRIISNPELIEKIAKPSDELLLAVVKQRPTVVRWIRYQLSEPVQLATVQQNGYMIQYFVGTVSDRVKIAALKKNGSALEYIKNPTPELQLMAVKQDPYAISLIKNPSEELQLLAVKKDPYVLKHIVNPSKDVQSAAVQQDGLVLYYIEKSSKAVQLAAVQQNGFAIQYVKNPSEAVQLAAVRQNPEAIFELESPTASALLIAVEKKPSIYRRLADLGYPMPKKVRDLYNSIKSAK